MNANDRKTPSSINLFPAAIMVALNSRDDTEADRLRGELLIAKIQRLLGDRPPLNDEQRVRLSSLILGRAR